MRERWIQKVALGALIFSAALVGSRGIVYQENSPAKTAESKPLSLNPPTEVDKIKAIFAELGDFVTPENFGPKNFPGAARFD